MKEFSNDKTVDILLSIPYLIGPFRQTGAKRGSDAYSNQIEELLKEKYSSSVFSKLRILEDGVRGLAGHNEHLSYFIPAIKLAWALEELINRESKDLGEAWEEARSRSNAKEKIVISSALSNRVFIVHGRDKAMREQTARFLERLDLEPVILHEQPNKGKTLIEKFSEYSDVGFAVVLLSPDDSAHLAEDQASIEMRARQNVVFEFGFFIGKLGRDRVCAIQAPGVTKPSDIDGIAYVPFDDSEGWQTRLLRELKAAGYEIDANKAFL